MDPSGLIAILGFLVAVIAIVPRERWLDLRIRFSRFDLFITAISLLIIHYIIYFEVFEELGVAPYLGPWQLGFNENNTIYLIFLALSIFLLFRAKFSKIKRSNIQIANDLFEQLLLEEKYFEVTLLTEKYIKDISDLSKKESLLNQLAKKILPTTEFEIIALSATPSIFDKFFPIQRLWLSSKLEREDVIREVAQNLLRRLVNNNGFIKYLAISRPYVGITIIEADSQFTVDFIDNFIDCLMDYKGSIYYFELEHNHINAGHHRYELTKNNKLLYYLFHDVTISEKHGIYKPVGDKVCNLLDYDKDFTNKYNQPLNMYYERERFKCPIDSSIHFFEIMILESMHQGIKWHMWLYYFPIFVNKILGKLEPSVEVDLNSEWPTPFHYILYHIIKVMIYWLEEFSHVDNKQPLEINNDNLTNDNGSIPKSTVLALGNILNKLIISPVLSDTFKAYILEVVLGYITNSAHIPAQEKINSLLIKSIIYSGSKNKVERDYITKLRNIYDQVDHVLRAELTDFNALLKNV